jgi:hypothetical protein
LASFVSAQICTDSDNGKEFYKYGVTSADKNIGMGGDLVNQETTYDFEDSCCVACGLGPSEKGPRLKEWWCENDVAYSTIYECPNGCENGKCIGQEKVTCSDSDEGISYFMRGVVIIKKESSETRFEDNCANSDSLVEYSCDATEPSLDSETFKCAYGCKDGACKKAEPTQETGPIELPKNIENLQVICNGCVLDNKCYYYGFRKSGSFCSDNNNQFTEQKKPDVSCDNNFECSSNVCVSGKCISESFIQKILTWFKRLFGAD